MKLAIMQPYFFPYIGYWQLINAVDKFVIFDDVNFIKRGWINRNYIIISQTKKIITLSLEKSSQNKLINEIYISKNKQNKQKILRTIEYNYKKAPYYLDAFQVVKDILNKEEFNLSKFLEYQIKAICYYLKIKTNIEVSSSIKKNNDLKSQEKILNICKILNANHYINPLSGKDLYNKEEFNQNRIKLDFLIPKEVPYKHFNNKFYPNLSIIDVMMFNSVDKIKEILDEYDFI
jgi:hypothetical protein